MRSKPIAQNRKTQAGDLKNAFALFGLSRSRVRAAAKVPAHGRPQAITAPVLAKLEIAYKFGCSDREACVFAGIHPSTLYRFSERNGDFCEQKDAWRELPILAARMVVVNAMAKGDVKVAQWYLERRGEGFSGTDRFASGSRAVTAEDLDRMARGDFEIIED